MSEPVFRMTKRIEEALEQGLDMFWQGVGGRIQLHAVTVRNENGTVRTRKLWESYSEGAARNVEFAVRERGGRLRAGALQRMLDERQRVRDEIVDGLYGRGGV